MKRNQRIRDIWASQWNTEVKGLQGWRHCTMSCKLIRSRPLSWVRNPVGASWTKNGSWGERKWREKENSTRGFSKGLHSEHCWSIAAVKTGITTTPEAPPARYIEVMLRNCSMKHMRACIIKILKTSSTAIMHILSKHLGKIIFKPDVVKNCISLKSYDLLSFEVIMSFAIQVFHLTT